MFFSTVPRPTHTHSACCRGPGSMQHVWALQYKPQLRKAFTMPHEVQARQANTLGIDNMPVSQASSLLCNCPMYLGRPVVPFYSFFGEGSSTKIDYIHNQGYPYSNLSTQFLRTAGSNHTNSHKFASRLQQKGVAAGTPERARGTPRQASVWASVSHVCSRFGY